jgi:hypothetical protein
MAMFPVLGMEPPHTENPPPFGPWEAKYGLSAAAFEPDGDSEHAQRGLHQHDQGADHQHQEHVRPGM